MIQLQIWGSTTFLPSRYANINCMDSHGGSLLTSWRWLSCVPFMVNKKEYIRKVRDAYFLEHSEVKVVYE